MAVATSLYTQENVMDVEALKDRHRSVWDSSLDPVQRQDQPSSVRKRDAPRKLEHDMTPVEEILSSV